jgi:hypothetical protein
MDRLERGVATVKLELRVSCTAAALAALIVSGAAWGAALDGDEISRVKDCYAANSPRKSSVLGVRLSVRDSVGSETESRFKLYWRRLRTGERRVMIRFSEPDFLSGAGLLVKGVRQARPRVHLYLPELGKPRRVTSRDQVESFLGRADLGLDEIGQMLDPLGSDSLRMLNGNGALDERAVWVVEARPVEDDPSRYARTVTYVDRTLCVPLRAEFYDGENQRTRLLQVDPDQVTREAESWIARELIFLAGDDESGTRTILRIDEVEVDIPLAPSLLTVPALSGIRG